MAGSDKLTLLKAELNMMNPPAERVTLLNQLLEIAASRIKHKGITLDDADAGDAHLQVEYAAWLYRRRMQQATAQMPEYLRLDLNDRLIHEKGQVISNG